MSYVRYFARLTLFLGVSIYVFSLGQACGKKPLSLTNQSSTANPVVGVVTTASFYVRVYDNNNNYTYKLHPTNSATDIADCSIQAGSTSKTLNCIVEAPELDLYFWGIKFQYNVPPQMCEYYTLKPYDYYTLDPGIGRVPDIVHVRKHCGSNASLDFAYNGKPAGSVGGKLQCPFDYSGKRYARGTGPNCCMGQYTYIVDQQQGCTIQPPPTPPPTANDPYNTTGYDRSTTAGDWGGLPGNCLDGPGAVGQFPTTDANIKGKPIVRNSYNMPYEIIDYTKNLGTNLLLMVDAPIEVNNTGNNIYAANYGCPQTPGSVPYACPNVSDPVYGYGFSTSPYYFWGCTDRAKDFYANIFVSVREWNEYQFFAPEHVSEAERDSTTTGSDTGGICQFGATEPGLSYSPPVNDFCDWKDYSTVNTALGAPRFPGY